MTNPTPARRRGGCGCIVSLLVVAALVGASVWLDAAAPSAVGRVREKREVVDVTSDGEWTRTWQLDVDFPPSRSGLRPVVTVDSARFARTRVGDSLRLHYVPCCPILARPAGRSTADAAAEVGRNMAFVGRWGIWLLAGLVGIVATYKRSRAAVLVVGVLWIVGVVALDTLVTGPGSAPRDPPRGPTAPARIRNVREVEYLLRPGRRSDGWRYNEPFEVATFAFVPAPGADSVVAVDLVDAGSVAGLAPDSVRMVRYDPARPREAQLVAGTRTFPARNRSDGVIVVVIVVTFLLGGGLLVADDSGRRRRRA